MDMFRKVFVKSLKDVTFTRFFYTLKPKNMETLKKRKQCSTEKCSNSEFRIR